MRAGFLRLSILWLLDEAYVLEVVGHGEQQLMALVADVHAGSDVVSDVSGSAWCRVAHEWRELAVLHAVLVCEVERKLAHIVAQTACEAVGGLPVREVCS